MEEKVNGDLGDADELAEMVRRNQEAFGRIRSGLPGMFRDLTGHETPGSADQNGRPEDSANEV